jgi:ADP-ribose pyrophosphatase YjhB (NUDIX family)
MERKLVLTVDGLVTLAHQEIVLIRRAKPPFMDKLVMPGGHVEASDVSIPAACARELEEEIGCRLNPADLQLLCVLDRPDADPRPGSA